MGLGIQIDYSFVPYLVWPDAETVSYRPPATGQPDSGQPDECDTSLRQQISLKEAVASGGYFVSRDCHWFLAGSRMGLTPRVGGIITRQSDGSEWTILEESYEDLDQVWDLICRNFALVENLTSKVNILRRYTRQDAAASQVIIDWLPVYGDVPARVQEVSIETVDERGRKLQQTTHQVFLGRRCPNVDHECVIEDLTTFRRYEFISSDSPENIAQLQTLTVRRTGDQLT